jgi:GAF domain-containing protein
VSPSALLTDPDRLAAVRRYEILDVRDDGSLDAVTRTAATVCGTPISTVSIVDADRIHFAAARGLPGVTQIGMEPGLCSSAFAADGAYVVSDAAADPRTADHPLILRGLKVRFYAAAPITSADGHRLGTVTVMDLAPRQLTDMQIATLGHLSEIVARHLDLRLTALRAARAEQDRARAAALAENLRAAAKTRPQTSRPASCQLGGLGKPCAEPAELKVADSWGDSAWGCPVHVEEVLLTLRTAFLASEEPGGLGDYLHRP